MWPLTQIRTLFTARTPAAQPDSQAWLTGDPPKRGDYLAEKLRGAVRMPAFLPWFDQQQNVGETETMRLQYRKMLSCPNVKPALLGKLMAVMGLDLKIQPASDHARHKEHAEFIEWNLTSRLSGGIPGFVWNILSGACIDGFSVNEKVWSIQDGEDSRWRLKRVLRALKPKDVNQDLVIEIDEFKNIIGVKGLRFNAGEVWSPKDFLIYSHLGLFGNPLGMSDLRAAYSRYWILNTVTTLRAMGAEKRALPIIWGEYPDPSKQTALENVLSRIKTTNWFAVPKDVRLQVLEVAGAASDYFASFRKDLQEEIFLSIQGATLQSLSSGPSQQRGNSAVHKDTADLFKWHLSEVICNCLNDHENGLIQDMLIGTGNYRDVGELPVATLTGVDDAELSESMRIDEGLAQLGWKHSKKELAKTYGRKPPEDPEDELQPPAGAQGGGDQFGLDSLLNCSSPDDQPIKPPEPNNRLAEYFAEWAPYKGPRGGDGWKNSATGAVVYGDKPDSSSAASGATTATQPTSQVESQAEKTLRNPSFLAKARKLPAQAIGAAKNAAVGIYNKAERKYGPRWAKAIVATAIVTAPTPVTMLSVGAMTGLAHIFTRSRRLADAHDEAPDMNEHDLRQAARAMLGEFGAALKRSAAFAEDASGHQHKGKWPGGGQFVKGAGSAVPAKNLLVKQFDETDPPKLRDLVQEIKSLLHAKVSAADVREMAKKIGTLSGAELDDLKRKLGIKAGGTIAQTAGKIAAHLKSPTFGSARVQVKHLLRNVDDPEQALPHIESLVKKLSPADQEKLAAAHKMDTDNFIYKAPEIARHIVDRAKGDL